MRVGGLLCIAIIVEKEKKKRKKRKSGGEGDGMRGFPLPCIYFYGDLCGKKKKKERKKKFRFTTYLFNYLSKRILFKNSKLGLAYAKGVEKGSSHMYCTLIWCFFKRNTMTRSHLSSAFPIIPQSK